MKNIPILSLLCTILLGALFLSSPLSVRSVQAIDFRSADAVTIAGEEVIDGSLFVSGNTVIIDGLVNGDVYCAGKTVTIRGDIKGDVLCGAQTLVITGIVDGNVRAAAQNMEIGADVIRNLTVAGQDILITSDAIVDGEVMSFGKTIKVDGLVQRSLLAMGERVSVNGTVGEGMKVKTNQLVIGEFASIVGESTYESEQAAIVDPDAQIEQPLVRETPRPELKKNYPTKSRHFPVAKIVFGAIFSFIVGWILLRLFPDFTQRASERIVKTPVQALLVGLLLLVGGPIVFVLLLITIIGIPLAFLWLFAWILVLMGSSTLCAFAVGDFISQRWWKAAKKSKLKQLAVGVVVLAVLLALPVVGWIARMVVALVGSGAITKALLNRKR